MVLSWSPTLSPWARSFPPYMCQPHRVLSFLWGFGCAMLKYLFLKWHVSLNVVTDSESWSFRCSSKNPAMNCVKCSVLSLSLTKGRAGESWNLWLWIRQIKGQRTLSLKAKSYVNSSAVANYSTLISSMVVRESHGQNVNEWVWLCFNKTLLTENRQQDGFGLWDTVCWSPFQILKISPVF